MKKTIFLVLAALLCMCAFGCEKEAEQPKLEALRDKSEFAVYEDGEQILTLEEIEMTDWAQFFFASPYSEYHGDDYVGNSYDYRGRDITTKRGIKIGSSMEDVVAAYTGIEFYQAEFDGDEFVYEIRTVEQVAEAEQRLREESGYEGYNDYQKTVWFHTDTYFLHDGSALSVSAFNERVKEEGWDYYNMQRNMDEYMDAFYELRFAVMEGAVTEISLLDEKAAMRID
ncbi:hypothetical protein LJC56_11910 [Christensenellaceae bacterium OttesenSCG-928-K19]|nr:hypothetical protein [Christensenellaceae bacterium OttesenSCG-928-K19]